MRLYDLVPLVYIGFIFCRHILLFLASNRRLGLIQTVNMVVKASYSLELTKKILPLILGSCCKLSYAQLNSLHELTALAVVDRRNQI